MVAKAKSRRSLALTIVTGAIVLSAASSAPAATQIGETFDGGNVGCPADATRLQAVSVGEQYAAPTSGVITSWSHQAGLSPIQLKLKVARPQAGTTFTILGESMLKSPVPNTLNTYTGVRIPVQPGDVIGLYGATAGSCGASASSGYSTVYLTGDQAPGSSTAYTNDPGLRFNIAASLEADADNDGFGDETQDQCPTEATTQGPCPVPDTAIIKGPKSKTKSKTAIFEFSSPTAGSSFECQLDDGPFQACSSPYQVRVRKGKHAFAVRATSKGQTDASPAVYRWKVKKKRPRRR